MFVSSVGRSIALIASISLTLYSASWHREHDVTGTSIGSGSTFPSTFHVRSGRGARRHSDEPQFVQTNVASTATVSDVVM